MDDVRVMLRDCSSKSLAFLDEIGKGTSARDGAALSGALLEALDAVPVTCVFATHLHEIFELPLHTKHLAWKRMGFRREEEDGAEGKVQWTYQLEDGRCLDSMAMHTARAYGIPPSILKRAQTLGAAFDEVCRGGGGGGGGGGSSISLFPQEAEKDRRRSPSLDHASTLMTEVLRSYASFSSSSSSSCSTPLRVAPGFDPTPALEGSACVYVLFLPSSSSFYVGETDSARQRLAQHRGKHGQDLEAVVVPVANKSEGRALEGLMIREMKRRGFALFSDKDGQRNVGL